MMDMEVIGETFALELREELARSPPVLRRACRKKLLNPRGINFRPDRPVLHLGEMLGQQIDHAVAEAAHLFARKRNAGAIRSMHNFFERLVTDVAPRR